MKLGVLCAQWRQHYKAVGVQNESAGVGRSRSFPFVFVEQAAKHGPGDDSAA